MLQLRITKQQTHLGTSIPSTLRLAIYLDYIDSGSSQHSLGEKYAVGLTTVGGIIGEVAEGAFGFATYLKNIP